MLALYMYDATKSWNPTNKAFTNPHLIDEETEVQGVLLLAQHHTAWEYQTEILTQAV